MTAVELAVGAIVRRADALLLIRRAHAPGEGQWSVPGGRVEPGESLADAVERELREETGLIGTCRDLVGHAERIGDGYHFVILDFEVAVASSELPVAGSDAADARFMSSSAISSLDLVDGLLDFLNEHGLLDAPGSGGG